MRRSRLHWLFTAISVVSLSASFVSAQDATVRGTVNVVHSSKGESGNSDVVIWLTDPRAKGTVSAGPASRLLQKGKKFAPHVIAVTVGTAIEFPNQDPFFHDVFSIYHGKPFDLGLYESGATRKVRFSEPGVSYIFCNIHPEMSAVVLALSTPHFAITAGDGTFRIGQIPPGKYKLEAWYEHASEAELAALSREVQIVPGDNALTAITLKASATPRGHRNKYGEPYPLDKPAKY
jgi:plastocyanin